MGGTTSAAVVLPLMMPVTTSALRRAVHRLISSGCSSFIGSLFSGCDVARGFPPWTQAHSVVSLGTLAGFGWCFCKSRGISRALVCPVSEGEARVSLRALEWSNAKS